MKSQEASVSVTTAEVLQGAASEVRVIGGLSPLYAECYVCAPATTCACAPCDNLAMHYGLLTAPADSVVVCAAGGLQDCGYVGELAGLDAINRGLAGFIIDGSIRDAADLERLQFPVFHVGTAPGSCAKQNLVSFGQPIEVRGVTVNPGDQIVADRDAVVVVPSERWSAVRDAALSVHEREDAMRARLRSGERLAAMISLPPDRPTDIAPDPGSSSPS